MPGGLTTTIAVLAHSGNEAASAVLLAALDVPERETNEMALAALLSRPDDAAAWEVLLRWNSLSDRCRALVARRPTWLSGALRCALADSGSDAQKLAVEAAVATRNYDLLPAFVAAALDSFNAHAPLAARAALDLAELLAEEVASPRDYRHRRDPSAQRNLALPGLERAAGELDQDARPELLEALVVLAKRDNAVLRRILHSPSDHAHLPLLDLLETSSRPAIITLLLSFLDDPHPPLAALQAIGRRTDVSFVRQVARKVGRRPAGALRANLHRIDSVPGVLNNVCVLDALSETEQSGVLNLVVAAAVKRPLALQVIAHLLSFGKPAGRLDAAAALAEFTGLEANELAVRGLADDDSRVRAMLARQLRHRGIPDAIERLLALLDSPHEIERQAAADSLEEYRFERFAANFENLTPESRRFAGQIVRRVDPQALTALRDELDFPARSRRRRALEMAVALDAVAELHDSITPLLHDDDQFLRVAAIHVLGTRDSSQTRQALRLGLLDPHPLVQEAAETALARLIALPDAAPADQPATLTATAGSAVNCVESPT